MEAVYILTLDPDFLYFRKHILDEPYSNYNTILFRPCNRQVSTFTSSISRIETSKTVVARCPHNVYPSGEEIRWQRDNRASFAFHLQLRVDIEDQV
jgi:hypothetical protein